MTQYLIDHYKITAFICQGVAGAVDASLQAGDIVLGTAYVQHDLDVTSLGFLRGEIPFQSIRYLEGSARLLAFAENACLEFRFRYRKGIIASGDQFIADEKKARELQREFNAIAVDMESAAIAQTCFLNKVPFISIKSISDKADRDASSDFSQSIRSASKNAFLLVRSLVVNFSDHHR